MSKNPDTNLARGLNCLERHQSVKPQTTMALCGYSELLFNKLSLCPYMVRKPSISVIRT